MECAYWLPMIEELVKSAIKAPASETKDKWLELALKGLQEMREKMERLL